MSFVRTENGFASDLVDMQARAAYSNWKWGHCVLVDTPQGQVQVQLSPKGRRLRIFLKGELLEAPNTIKGTK
jgi:hypothetical protein